MVNRFLQRLGGLAGIGLGWGFLWGALFVATGAIIGTLDPASIDPGESPVRSGTIGLAFGFVSRVGFGIVLAFTERGRRIGELAPARAAIWGALGSSAFPLLTTMNNSLLLVACPLGAACASASLAIARRAERSGPDERRLLKWIGRLVALPLRQVCASNE